MFTVYNVTLDSVFFNIFGKAVASVIGFLLLSIRRCILVKRGIWLYKADKKTEESFMAVCYLLAVP